MQEPVETIHVYIVAEKDTQQDQPVVDSTTSNAPMKTAQPHPLVQKPRSRHAFLVPLIIVAVHLMVVIAVFFIHMYPILTATATITIIPKSYDFTTRLTLDTVQSRVFQPLTLTQTKTVRATGKGHQDATVATGTITLYNAATFPQTIDAGTLFIGADGQHIVTDEVAPIPGATPPLEGHVTVSAHAVNTGAAGNIQAGDIQGACCRENMFAYNGAFSGGQDERNYPVVRKLDIDNVVSSVLPMLTQSIRHSLRQLVRPHETLTTPQCSQHIASDHHAGDEASAVRVTVSESCLAGAYSSKDLQTKVTQALAQQAAQIVGTGYLLVSYSPTAPLQTSIQHQTLVLSAIYQARMIYEFPSQELTTLCHHLAGKSKAQAIQALLHLPGVEKITVRLSGEQNHLPTDTGHIHIAVLYSDQ